MHGVVGLGSARLGRARPGREWLGLAWRGKGANGTKNRSRKQPEMKRYFKQDDQIRLIGDKLREAFMPTLKRGDILLWADIEKVVGESRTENRAKYIIKKFRSRVLNELNIFLMSVVNVGLKACSPEEQVEHGGVTRQRKAMRQARRGLKEVRAVEPGDLSLHQQRIRASSIDQLKLTQRMARRGAKETSAIKKPEPLPRIAFVKSSEAG